jgi:hypothetical protein
MKVHLSHFVPLGVLTYRNLTGIFVRRLKKIGAEFFIIWSDDEVHYRTQSKEVVIYLTKTKKKIPSFAVIFNFLAALKAGL